jgi:hypothetical protein
MVKGREFRNAAAVTEFRVWVRNVAKVDTSALVFCCGGFVSFLMTTLVVACGVLLRGDAAEFVNSTSICY